jgi:methylmalonyl-CoA/ethylmalonyl-CoA epimerase
MKPTKINHIALGVSDMKAALKFWHQALGLELERIEEVPQEQAKVAFLPIGDTEIELVEPTTDDSGLAKFLAQRGPSMNHICLEVEDIRAMMTHLRSLGIELINQEPQTRDDGKLYAFIHPKSAHGVLVELYQLP